MRLTRRRTSLLRISKMQVVSQEVLNRLFQIPTTKPLDRSQLFRRSTPQIAPRQNATLSQSPPGSPVEQSHNVACGKFVERFLRRRSPPKQHSPHNDNSPSSRCSQTESHEATRSSSSRHIRRSCSPFRRLASLILRRMVCEKSRFKKRSTTKLPKGCWIIRTSIGDI